MLPQYTWSIFIYFLTKKLDDYEYIFLGQENKIKIKTKRECASCIKVTENMNKADETNPLPAVTPSNIVFFNFFNFPLKY